MKFIDTNVLVYVADDADAAKQSVSREIVREALTTNGCLISAQVLNEFSSVLFKKLKKTAQEVADAGFEGTGWSFYEGSGALFFAKDGMGYNADVTAPADFDMDSEFEFDDLLGFTVEGFRFNEPEGRLPMD